MKQAYTSEDIFLAIVLGGMIVYAFLNMKKSGMISAAIRYIKNPSKF